MLYFDVNGQVLKRRNNKFVAADSIDYLQVHFAFNDEWDGLVKAASFEKGATKYTIALTSDEVRKEDHLNLSEGVWYVGVVGVEVVDGTTVERITTGKETITVEPSMLADGSTPPASPLTFAEQLLAAAQQSLFELAVANGYDGTLEQWLDTLVGEKLPTLASLGAAALIRLAPEYAETTYALGAFVTRAATGLFYECTSAIGTPEAWTAGHWMERTVGYVLAALATSLAGKATAAQGALAETALQAAPTGFYYVSTTGNDAKSGKSPSEAMLTLQAAVDAAAPNGVVFVGAGTYTLTAALNMRPGVKIIGANATITQGNGAGLTILVNFSTHSAHGASLSGFILDGNRDNNADNANSFIVYNSKANDIEVSGCVIQNSTGYAFYVSNGLRPKFFNNRVSNAHVSGVAILASTAGTLTRAIVKDNIFISPLGQHPIMLSKSAGNTVSMNKIVATLVGGVNDPMMVDTDGTTITWASGPDFADVSPGMFLVMNGGGEYYISSKESDTSLTTSGAPGTHTGELACIGEGDLISISSCEGCDISENMTDGGATGGIVVSNSNGADCSKNSIARNIVRGCGTAGISTQSVTGTVVTNNSYLGNLVIDCALSGDAGPGSYYNSGLNFIGAEIFSSLVDGNFVVDTKVSPVIENWLAIQSVTAGQIHVGKNTLSGIADHNILGGSAAAQDALADMSVRADGWINANDVWTYASANTITVASGAASKYAIGDSIRWKQGGTYKYGVISAVADTLLTIIVNTDYTVDMPTAITDNYYTHLPTATGLPAYYNFTPTYSNMTVGMGENIGRYKTDGRKIEVIVRWTFGSGAAVASDVKINLPVAFSLSSLVYKGVAAFYDSSASAVYFGNIRADGYFKYYSVSGTLMVLGYLTSTAPFTWDTNDTISLDVVYSF